MHQPAMVHVVTVHYMLCRFQRELGLVGATNTPHRAAMRAYFILNAFSLYCAATDLLLVLVFLLPGTARRFRGSEQVC